MRMARRVVFHFRIHIHHQVSGHFAEAHHGEGGDAVQDQLGRRAGLQARGAGEYFRADGWCQDELRHFGAAFESGIKQINAVRAPRWAAVSSAPHTNGVLPLAAMPITTSFLFTPRN